MTRQPMASESGVTLIETLVALFVIALMATAGALMTVQSLRGARSVEAKGDAATQLSIAAGRIRDDLAAFVPRTSRDAADIESPALFSGYPPRHDGRMMVFVRNGWGNPAGDVRSGLQRVEYLFEKGRLIRRSWAAADPGPQTRSYDDLLLVGLESVEARYGRGDTWSSEWINTPDAAQPLPQKVELTLRFKERDVVTLRLLLGAGT